MPKLQQISRTGQFTITVPAYVVKALNATKGSKVEFVVDLKRGQVRVETVS